MAPRSRVVDALLQRALEVWEALAAAAEAQIFADVVAALVAASAGSARQADFESDLVADFEVCDAGADGGDDAGALVAERQGLADEDVAIAVVGVVVQVAAAEAGGGNADLEFVGFGLGEGAGLLRFKDVLDSVPEWLVAHSLRCWFTVRRSFAPWRTEAWTWVDMVCCGCSGRVGMAFSVCSINKGYASR